MVQIVTPSMPNMILQTNAGNKPTSHKAKVPIYSEVWFDNQGMATFLVSLKLKINITSLTIPQWNQPSMCILRIVASNFTGVQSVYITTNQNTRLAT